MRRTRTVLLHLAVAVAVTAAPAFAPARAQGAGTASASASPPRGTADGVCAPGDRILLFVEGERALSDTFTVRPGPVLDLPQIGSVSLAGVRRDQVEHHLQAALGRFLKNPVVHARALVRVGIVGEVTRPGFYALPADALVSDALTAAGGLTHEARVDAIHIERNGKRLVADDVVRRALAQGATLSQAGIDPGDQLVVPRKPDAERTWRIIGIIVSIPAAIVAVAFLRR